MPAVIAAYLGVPDDDIGRAEAEARPVSAPGEPLLSLRGVKASTATSSRSRASISTSTRARSSR